MEAPHSSRLRVAARPREIRGLDGLRALAIAADGQYPGQNVTFDVRARVKIRPGFRR